jgi:predicted metal-binding protein
MTKLGIIICARYRDCGGGKCFRALRERVGAFSRYGADEKVEIVGYTTCGGCPGGNVEDAPAEFLKNGCDAVHLATGLVVGYPPCPYIREFQEFIKARFDLEVVLGTHPIPLKYKITHAGLPFWEQTGMEELAGDLMAESTAVMAAYD